MTEAAPRVAAPVPRPEVLIVDDVPENLQVLGLILADEGLHVRLAAHGDAALRSVAARHPDLILLDVHMPGLDGFAVCRALREDPATANIPVLFLSGSQEQEERLLAFSAGARDFIAKPFHAAEVLARVRTHLRLQSMQRELDDQNRHLEAAVALRTRDLAAAHARLAGLEQAKGEFLGAIAHVLRTPLNGILGIAELLLDSSSEAPALREDYHQARADMLALLDQAQLLAETAVSQGAQTGRIAVAAALDAALAGAAAGQPNGRVRVSCDAASHAERQLCGDPRLIIAVLATLVSYAARLARSGGAVAVRCADGDAATLCLHVAVETRPISEGWLTAIFDARAALRGGVEEVQLRPLLVRRLTELLGGSATAAPEQGGMLFTLRLPAA